jgi:hypothetical protein
MLEKKDMKYLSYKRSNDTDQISEQDNLLIHSEEESSSSSTSYSPHNNRRGID